MLLTNVSQNDNFRGLSKGGLSFVAVGCLNVGISVSQAFLLPCWESNYSLGLVRKGGPGGKPRLSEEELALVAENLERERERA